MAVEEQRPTEKRLRDRSATDLLVLMLAGTICAIVLGSAITLFITGIIHPESEHTGAAALVADTLQMLISLLAGFLAGRTESTARMKGRDDV